MPAPLLKEMILRLGLPMSCRAVAWRLLLNVAHPTSETCPPPFPPLCSSKSRRHPLPAFLSTPSPSSQSVPHFISSSLFVP